MVIASVDTDKHFRGSPATSVDSCVTAVYMRWRYRRYARAGDPGNRRSEDHPEVRAGTPSLVQFPNNPALRQQQQDDIYQIPLIPSIEPVMSAGGIGVMVMVPPLA